jgi:hypothetical protein
MHMSTVDPKRTRCFPSQGTRESRTYLPKPGGVSRSVAAQPAYLAKLRQPLPGGFTPAVAVSMMLWLGIAAVVFWIVS